jgi:putative hydrolase of the HAD superfamily
LIEPWPSVGHIYAGVAERFGAAGISPALLNQRFTAAWKQLRNFGYTEREWSQLVDETFTGLTSVIPSASFFPELYAQFGRAAAWHVFDDVKPALAELDAAGLKLAVVSNWDERLQPLLVELGLSRWFAATIVSCEAGCCKPDPEIFQKAGAQLGVAASQILHVGDTPGTDVDGARNAGFQALELKRGARQLEPGQINSLRMLISAINESETSSRC